VAEEHVPVERHAARDRFGRTALRMAHDLSSALAGAGEDAAEPLVLRTDGQHRTIAGLAALIDAALDGDADHPVPRTSPAERPGAAG
jgi:hypothetical protein